MGGFRRQDMSNSLLFLLCLIVVLIYLVFALPTKWPLFGRPALKIRWHGMKGWMVYRRKKGRWIRVARFPNKISAIEYINAQVEEWFRSNKLK
jgi:hypothetical protein